MKKNKKIEEKAKTEQSKPKKMLLLSYDISPEEAWKVFKRTFEIGEKKKKHSKEFLELLKRNPTFIDGNLEENYSKGFQL